MKRHFLAQNRAIWRIKRKNRFNGLACRRVQEPKKCSKFRTGGVYISPIWGAKTPWRIEPNFFGGRRPRCNHAIQIWWRSVQGFWVGWGSKFAFSHILWRSSLQHSHYRVMWCWLNTRNHTALDKKSNISLILFFPGSAETDIRPKWGRKISGYLMVSFLRNRPIRTKNY